MTATRAARVRVSTTSAIARPRSEPAETDSLVNDALDLIEGHVRTVLDAGGEAALRARLARLLGNGVAPRLLGDEST